MSSGPSTSPTTRSSAPTRVATLVRREHNGAAEVDVVRERLLERGEVLALDGGAESAGGRSRRPLYHVDPWTGGPVLEDLGRRLAVGDALTLGARDELERPFVVAARHRPRRHPAGRADQRDARTERGLVTRAVAQPIEFPHPGGERSEHDRVVDALAGLVEAREGISNAVA